MDQVHSFPVLNKKDVELPPVRQPESYRVGVFIGAVGSLNKQALTYLLLQLNLLQSTIIFEMLPLPPRAPLLDTLQHRKRVSRKRVEELAVSFAKDIDELFLEVCTEYGLKDSPPAYYIVLTTVCFDDEFYLSLAGRVGIVALGNWKKRMAPPSLIEFFLFLTFHLAMGLVEPRAKEFVHLGTRGCALDLTPILNDARYSILLGSICPACQRALQGSHISELLPRIPEIAGKQWLGRRDDPLSPAAIACKLGYDLFVSKGAHTTFREGLQSALASDGPKELIKWILAFLLAGVLVWSGIKGS